MQNWAKAIISISTPLIVGFTSSQFTETGEKSWYRSISKPGWNPPGWVFGPVWTVLYVLMRIALFIIWKSNAETKLKNKAIAFWIIQMVLNFFWTVIFFGQQNIAFALIEIFILWLSVLITIFLFAKINKLAARLLVPYLIWLTFALLLNHAIWQLNNG